MPTLIFNWRLRNINIRLNQVSFPSTGSLLVGKTAQESLILKQRVDQLSKAGFKAEFLSTTNLLEQEPALSLDKEGGAAFLPDDYQLDARQTVAYIEKVIKFYALTVNIHFYQHASNCCHASTDIVYMAN